jgi:hypothetical protein
MGFSFRKSFRILPGIRISLSRRGPRLSVGIPGVRASVGMNGKARIYGGEGPLRYQKTVSVGPPHLNGPGIGSSLRMLIEKIVGKGCS